MKKVKSLLLAAVLTAAFGYTTAEVWAKDGVMNSTKAGETSYCHMHFPAMVESTLSSDRPVLQDPSSGEIIHFYGSCDYDPHGKDAIQTQKRDQQRRFQREYHDG